MTQAGLFSAVSSAFIIQIQPAPASEPPSLVVISQSLLYFSLFTTLLAALLAVLGKQWVMYYQAAGSRGSIQERGLESGTAPILHCLDTVSVDSNRAIAIIVLVLTSFGLASYIFLLGSAIMSPDSPFQTPLAPFLVLVFSTLWKPVDPLFFKLWDAIRSVWSMTWSRIVKWKGHILPRFALRSKHSNNTVTDDLYPADYFAPPSVEGPAVLWVLETSTDPLVITTAADISIDLQWSLDADLSSSTKRLEETFYSCFTDGDLEGDLQSGMSHLANTCGMAWGSLRVPLMGHIPAISLPIRSNHFRHGTTAGDILRIILGSSISTTKSEDLLRWSFHITPAVRLARSFKSNFASLQQFIDQFQVDTMPTLDYSSFANYLCCINSFLSWVDPRVVVQVNKRKFRNQLKIQLFKALQSTTIDNSLIAKIIYTAAQLERQIVVQQGIEESTHSDGEFLDLDLVRALSEFCCGLSRNEGWLDVVISAASIATSRVPTWLSHGHVLMYLQLNTHRMGSNLKTPDIDWIYLALQHVQQRLEKEQDIRDPDKDEWDADTTLLVDKLLRVLLCSGSLPGTPPVESLHVILRALSCPRGVSTTAFIVFHWAQSWFLDPTLQPIIQQYPVWSRLGYIAGSYVVPLVEYFVEMGSNISNSAIWMPLIYQDLPNWITSFSHRGDDVWSPWVFNSFVEKFIAVIRTIWVLDWDPPYKFRNISEESWALAIEALSNVWQSFAFTPTPVRLFIQMSKSTVLVSFKMVYYPRLWEKNALSSPLRAIFASKLGTSLLKAAQNARNTISATNTGLENTNIQQIAQFLDALGGKIGTDFEPGSGEVEIGGETKAYQNWGELRKHFNAELNRLEELWKDT
ncbi:hypothetical protein B0H11DRAFT_2402442 [Mycena galericulata]|nr:hypothetical protein B0H11DRAFT_2402442 [Mycena galericulata]